MNDTSADGHSAVAARSRRPGGRAANALLDLRRVAESLLLSPCSCSTSSGGSAVSEQSIDRLNRDVTGEASSGDKSVAMSPCMAEARALELGSKWHQVPSPLEEHFEPFRRNTVGFDAHLHTPYGRVPLIYCDYIASGRMYGPIEDELKEVIGPFIANTHTEASTTGRAMTRAYHSARQIIKQHVNAGPGDALFCEGSGMTGAVVKLQRMLGIAVPPRFRDTLCATLDPDERALVVVTQMEHHSNHLSWQECLADVQVLDMDPVSHHADLTHLQRLLSEDCRLHPKRKLRIGAFTAASNVTGVMNPIHEMARIMHQVDGVIFVDFAAAAPYARMDMHPKDDPLGFLDGLVFSPHKFLVGLDLAACCSSATTWSTIQCLTDLAVAMETREDGGTPPFIQTIRAALAMRLKEEMGVDLIARREEELLKIAFAELQSIPGLYIHEAGAGPGSRIGIISFGLQGKHDLEHNLVVSLLSHRFGIETRGGCSCAGVYGHYLLDIDEDKSRSLFRDIYVDRDVSNKPGWVRLSLHPTMTNVQLFYVTDSIRQVAANIKEWKTEYYLDPKTGEWIRKDGVVIDPVNAEERWGQSIAEIGVHVCVFPHTLATSNLQSSVPP